MARPRKTKSVDAQTSTGAGASIETGGRTTVSIFVVARNYASADTLEVMLESSPNGDEWADTEPLEASSKAMLQDSDLNDRDNDGTYTSSLTLYGVAAEEIRANVISFTDDSGTNLEVDVWLLVTNNPDGAQSFREV